MRAGVRPGMPPAVLLSIGIHLIVIFGFLVTPMGDSAARVANRAVSVLLMTSERAPTGALTDALDNQSRGAGDIGQPSLRDAVGAGEQPTPVMK